MKKFLSALLTIILFLGLGYLAWTHPAFCQRQINKVKAVYYVYKGDRAYKKLKLNKAIKYYNTAVKLYPEHYGAWNNLGNIYVVYEDYFSAVDAYEQAFEHNPKMMVARMNYGIVSAERLGDFDGAINQYEEILNTKRHLLSIPFIYSNRRSYKANKGIAYYNKGVALKLKSIYNDYNYVERRRILLKALEAYKEACKILKRDYDARYNLALAYHLLSDYREAGLSYCKAIELSPMKYEAHYNLAVLLRHLHYYKESMEELEKASTLIMDSPNGRTERQRYIFDVMNDVTRSLAANSNSNLIEKLGVEKPDKAAKVTYVHGKIVMSDDLDKAMLRNFKVCTSKKILKEDVDPLPEGELNDVRFDVNVPGVE